jgi:hypothetical protein
MLTLISPISICIQGPGVLSPSDAMISSQDDDPHRQRQMSSGSASQSNLKMRSLGSNSNSSSHNKSGPLLSLGATSSPLVKLQGLLTSLADIGSQAGQVSMTDNTEFLSDLFLAAGPSEEGVEQGARPNFIRPSMTQPKEAAKPVIDGRPPSTRRQDSTGVHDLVSKSALFHPAKHPKGTILSMSTKTPGRPERALSNRQTEGSSDSR